MTKKRLFASKKDQKRGKNLNSQLLLTRLVLLVLTGWFRFCFVAGASDLSVSLAMKGAILTRGDVAVSFSK